MSSLEARQELSLDFIRNAEQAAMDKVMDIYEGRPFKHGFYRYPSATDKSVDRLKGIFRYGVISQNFARRIKADFVNNYHDKSNLKGISIFTKHIYISDALGTTINTQIRTVDQDGNIKIDYEAKLPIENVFVLLINKDINTYPTSSPYIPPNGYEPERLVACRIKQKQFQGIVIIDSKKTSDSEGIYSIVQCQDNIEWDSSTPLNTTKLIVEEMLAGYKDNPSLAIPVYGTSGALYWPKQIPYPNIQQLYSPKEKAK